MIFDKPRFSMRAGDVLDIEVGDEISLSCSAKVHSIFESLRDMKGVGEVTPAYASLGARVDARTVKVAAVIKRVEKAWAKGGSEAPSGRLVKVPVCYDGEYAPDIEWVAQKAGLKREEVVALHSSREYTCMMLGFAPGFVYLDEVDPKIRADRLETPRTKVPEGSVGIAGAQTGIYGLESPGGWRLIGRTPLTMFNPRSTPPVPIGPGDHVKFEPVTAREFKFIKSAPAAAPAAQESIPILDVEQPGLFATVQDLGRLSFRHLGVPRSGGLDRLSQVQANYIVGNVGDAPTVEILGGYFKVRALTDVVLSVTGADCDLQVGRSRVETYSAILLREGELLAVGKSSKGFINYLAVAGTLSAQSAMGSCSTYVRGSFGGYQGRALKPGDVLGAARLPDRVFMRSVPTADRIDLSGQKPLKAVRGARLEPHSLGDAFYEASYSVSESSDRTGFRLKASERLPHSPSQVLTYPTYPGYVQSPPDGNPIALQQDCPTTGGYPLVASVLSSDLGRLSQLRPGDKLTFEEVDDKSALKDAATFTERLLTYSRGATET